MDNVVLRLLIPVCTVLRREREQQIHDLALHDMQLHNELTSYQRSQVGVEVVIHRNNFYTHSPLYQMIRRDIENSSRLSGKPNGEIPIQDRENPIKEWAFSS